MTTMAEEVRVADSPRLPTSPTSNARSNPIRTKRGCIILSALFLIVGAIVGSIFGVMVGSSNDDESKSIESQIVQGPAAASVEPSLSPTLEALISPSSSASVTPIVTPAPTIVPFERPSPEECEVIALGEFPTSDLLELKFMVEMNIRFNIQTPLEPFMEDLAQTFQQNLAPELAGCLDDDYERNLFRRLQSKPVFAKTKFGVLQERSGSCTAQDGECYPVEMFVSMYVDDPNTYISSLVVLIAGAFQGNLVETLDIPTPFESIELVSVYATDPTRSPTISPSWTPSLEPTPNPTIAPTTPRPTVTPGNPTAAPTTPFPTKTPTRNPTKEPTKNPTKEPTKSPTKQPTRTPTTRSPTKSPTRNPTAKPTTPETSEPTEPPTFYPTYYPTSAPAEVPSGSAPTSDIYSIVYPVSGSILDNSNSNQAQAVAYLESSNFMDYIESEQEVIELYVVTLFWYATGGNNWDDDANFFGSVSICDWNKYGSFGVFCNSNGLVTELIIYENNAQGTLVEELSFLESLEILELYTNELTGTIPSEIASLPSLKSLELSDNAGLQGNLVTLFNSFPFDIEEFGCAECVLSGSLSSIDWSPFGDLWYLELYDSGIAGRIPSSLGNARNLRFVSLSENFISGTIPASVGALPNLGVLDIYDNDLTGEVPQFVSEDLYSLDLSYNLLSGHIANLLFDLPPLELQSLWLSDNVFYGVIPDEIGLYTELLYFSVANNNIEGTLPNTLGNLNALVQLGLEGNYLSGTIPDALARLPNLEMLHLYDNQFTDNLNDAFCPTTISDFVVDCGSPEWVACSCCSCYSS